MILTQLEAATIYRAMCEANNLDCPTFGLSIRRPEKRAIRFAYGAWPYNDGPHVLVFETKQTEYGVSALYHDGDPIERHTTQDAFREAYNLPL